MFGNYVLGFCIWDIPAFIAFIAVAAALFVQQHNHHRRSREAEHFLSASRSEQPVNDEEQTKDE